MNSLLYMLGGRNRSHLVEQLIPSVLLLVVTGILCLATCYSTTTRSLLFVVTETSLCLHSLRGNITESLLSNGHLLRLNHSGFQPLCHSIFAQAGFTVVVPRGAKCGSALSVATNLCYDFLYSYFP
jgi:hypothetical protein